VNPDLVDDLERTLAELPALISHLESTLARQVGRGTTNGPRTSERPLPFNPRAGTELRKLHALLLAWVSDPDTVWVAPTDLAALGVHIRTRYQPPAGEPADLARVLFARLDGILRHPDAEQLLARLTDLTAKAWAAVDVPPDRMFFGLCECGAELRVEREQVTVQCPRCLTDHQVAAQMQRLEVEVANLLLPIRDIARMAAFLGEFPDTARTEAKLNLWVHRKQLKPAGLTRDGRPTYPYRQVVNELHRRVARRHSA
jgi:hypothetical protein